jgi:uncharacterized protein (TIGR02145 family)
MAENLNYAAAVGSSCFSMMPQHCDTYGRLYTWTAALTACPSGWRLPMDDDWRTLEMALGMSASDTNMTGLRGTNQGQMLKSATDWNGTDCYGFNALPAGNYASNISQYINMSMTTLFWTSTEGFDGGDTTYYRVIRDNQNGIYRWHDQASRNGYQYSVRCVADVQ